MFKLIKWSVIGGIVVLLAGGFFFGRDLFSYAFSSGNMVRTAVRDAIPTQFEIQRARDLLQDLVPEMRANLKIVAQEEVEVAGLEKEVGQERDLVSAQRAEVQKLRSDLDVRPASATDGRKDFVEEVSRKFDRLRSNEQLLATKEKLLSNRRKNLQAAIAKLEKTRIARVELAAQIDGLEAKCRMLEAQGAPSDLKLNETKLAQTQRLLADLRKRLDVDEKYMERAAELDPSDEPAGKKVSAENLMQEIDDHFHAANPSAPPAPPAAVPTTACVESNRSAGRTR